jgi:hypothetical protein
VNDFYLNQFKRKEDETLDSFPSRKQKMGWANRQANMRETLQTDMPQNKN